MQKVIETLLEIVKIDSPTGEEEHLAEYLKQNLSFLGYKPYLDKVGNVITRIEGNPSKDTIMLSAHMDTVEPGRGIEPYIDDDGWVRSRGGTILGADNKSAVAVFLDLVRRLKEEGNSSNHTIELVFTVSEESGNHGARGIDTSKLESKRGYISDTSGRNLGDIITASPFYNRFDIELVGQEAHASRPELAVNVVSIFGEILNNLILGKVSENSVVNIGVVESGSVPNTVPGQMTLIGEIRSMYEEELVELSSELERVCKSACDKFEGKAVVTITRENGGFVLDENSEFFKRTLEILKEDGLKPDLVKSWGCYDANIFFDKGIETVNIADGSQDAHTKNERVHVDNLTRMSELMWKLVHGL